VVTSLRGAARGARVVSLQPSRLKDVFRDIHTVAEACRVPERGEAVVFGLESRLRALEARVSAARARPRVAVVEWPAPPMLAGHWVPETIAAAGGTTVGPPAGGASAYVSFEEIRALRPEAVVVAPCGFDLERTLRESEPHLSVLRGLAPRLLFMDGNAYLNRPGPRLVTAAETLATWLRGEPLADPRVRTDSVTAEVTDSVRTE
jgi:iron complex transport system substrate-binding protein